MTTTSPLLDTPSPSGSAASNGSAPVDRFVRPPVIWYLLYQPGFVLLAAMSTSPVVYDLVAARAPRGFPARRRIRQFSAGLLVVHIGEAVYARRTAKAAGLTRSARRWAIETLLLGFPVLRSLRAATR